MLDELIVSNLGIIERAHIEPRPGLTVITGETGAGKTLLLGALRLLLGGEPDQGLVGPFADETVVDGRFVTDAGDEVAVRRRIPRDGRSRSYVDGGIASARLLTELTSDLVDIVGQHDHLSLTRPVEVRRMLDSDLDDPGRAVLARYRAAWSRARDLRERRDALGGDRRALERERDLLVHQAKEIEAAGFKAGDDQRLDGVAVRLRNLNELREAAAAASVALDTSREDVGMVLGALQRVVRLDPSVEEVAEAAAEIEARVEDLALEVSRLVSDLDVDPSELEDVEARLARLADLRRKYGQTLDDILEYGAQAAERARELGLILDDAEGLLAELARAEDALTPAADALRVARSGAGRRLAQAARDHLRELGFESPVVAFDVAPTTPASHGGDAVTLRFASDSRLTPGDVASVASGGELSRLVLSLRLAAGVGRTATLVFDEVDAGIGGATALAMGRKLAALATGRQVLCVTHLPHVAAFADSHLVIERDGVSAQVRSVDSSERLEELSRMLAGMPDSERGRQAAEELVALARDA